MVIVSAIRGSRVGKKMLGAVLGTVLIAGFGVLGIAAPANAYNLDGCKVSGGATIVVVVPALATTQTGYSTAFNAAVNDWRNHTDVNMSLSTSPTDPNLDISGDVENYGTTNWSGYTLRSCQSNGYYKKYPGVRINTYYTNPYSTVQRQSVIAHELGHALGLNHNFTTPIKLMNGYDPDRFNAGVYITQTDDRNGVNYLY